MIEGKRFIFLPGLLLLVFLHSGCQPKYSIPPMYPGNVPDARQPGKHPTQRPYVINNKRYYPISTAQGYRETGTASWYGKDFHGKKTSNGERYDMYAGTAAHKTLPMDTVLLVQNLDNGKETVVRVNDRGPFVKSRIIDVSYAAARKLDMTRTGTARVRITALAENTESASPSTEPAREPARETVGGKYYVQVGAFANIENARRLAREIADTGKKVYLRYNPNRQKAFYRVLVHGGTSLSGARSIQTTMIRTGFPNAFVVSGSN